MGEGKGSRRKSSCSGLGESHEGHHRTCNTPAHSQATGSGAVTAESATQECAFFQHQQTHVCEEHGSNYSKQIQFNIIRLLWLDIE
ncbi:hypothetical protein NQZ68_017608 [Dissostichus eleginoides]|nr:hypothetical protein NQZ68_017608 [Dissostichus eleginoides]